MGKKLLVIGCAVVVLICSVAALVTAEPKAPLEPALVVEAPVEPEMPKLPASPAVVFPADIPAQPNNPSSVGQETKVDDEDDEVVAARRKKEAEQKQLKHRKLTAKILKQLLTADLENSIKAGIALEEIAEKSDVPLLAKTLGEARAVEAQLSIIGALAKLEDPRAVSALRFELENGKLAVALAATEALGHIGGETVVSLLSHHLKKRSVIPLQERLAVALGRIGTNRAIYSLRDAERTIASYRVRRTIKMAIQYGLGEFRETVANQQITPGRRLYLNYYGLPYWVYHPAYRPKNKPKPRMLICVNDSNLDFSVLNKKCFDVAKKFQWAVVIPVFHPILFPEYGSFNIRGKRADKHLLRLIDFLTKKANLETRTLFMYGHGTGGDFVQRFAMAYPERIARAAFYSRSFTLADDRIIFPFGLKTNPRAPDLVFDLMKFAKTQTVVIIDDRENKRRGEMYYNSLLRFIRKKGLMSDIAVRRSKVGSYLENSWQISANFLFANN